MMKTRHVAIVLGVLIFVQPIYSEVTDTAVLKLVESIEGLRADIRNCLCSSSPPTYPPTVSPPSAWQSVTSPLVSPTSNWPQSHETTRPTASTQQSSSAPSTPPMTASDGTLRPTDIPLVPYQSCEAVPPFPTHPQYVVIEDPERRLYLCDTATDGGRWTVIQRRYDGSVDFQQPWEAYETGFGDARGEYWLGLSQVYHKTHGKLFELRVDIIDASGQKYYAVYKPVTIGHPSDLYRLGLGSYSGSAGNYLGFGSGSLDLNGAAFSTYDSDNDQNPSGSCSLIHGRGGWWFKDCAFANLNGEWGRPAPDGVHWGTATLNKHVEMKIRPISL